MPISAKTFRVAILGFSVLLPAGVHAEGIDTEHLFGFMIGTDVGNVGEREFQSRRPDDLPRAAETTGRSASNSNWNSCPPRISGSRMGSTFAAHDINGVPGFDDRRQLAWQGVSVDFRYRFLDRDTAPFGLTLAMETHADRIDETTAAAVRNYGTEFTLAFDREIVPNVAVAALNLIYQPEWTRFVGTGAAEQESTDRRCVRRDGAGAPGRFCRRRGALFAEI